jgi:hypothetical protein
MLEVKNAKPTEFRGAGNLSPSHKTMSSALLASLCCLGGLALLPTASVPTFGCLGSLVHSFSEFFGFFEGLAALGSFGTLFVASDVAGDC